MTAPASQPNPPPTCHSSLVTRHSPEWGPATPRELDPLYTDPAELLRSDIHALESCKTLLAHIAFAHAHSIPSMASHILDAAKEIEWLIAILQDRLPTAP